MGIVETEEKWIVKNVRDLGWVGVMLCLMSAVVVVLAFIVVWKSWG